MEMRKKAISYFFIIAILISTMTGCVKIVKIGEESKLIASEEFDTVSNVDEMWDVNILPELLDKTVSLQDLLNDSRGDLELLGDNYGKIAEGGALNFTVKGSGQVILVNTDSRAGYMEIDLDGYDKNTIIKLQIGPVFKGTAVRDSSDIVKFADYTNQVDYAAASKSIHDKIYENIISDIDVESLIGKNIEFAGCFTFENNDELLITPIRIVEN